MTQADPNGEPVALPRHPIGCSKAEDENDDEDEDDSEAEEASRKAIQ